MGPGRLKALAQGCFGPDLFPLFVRQLSSGIVVLLAQENITCAETYNYRRGACMHSAKVTILCMWVVFGARGQRALDDEGFAQWRTGNARITVFDIRGDDPVDSIVYPAYYTVDPLRWIDSMGCRRRVLIYCHHGGGASEVAGRLVARGYPADSVFFSGYSVITSSRFPATDTLPLHMLSRRAEPSRTMSPQELQALIHSDRAYRAVDVRTVEETEAGMIPGACVIPWPELFKSQLNRLGRRETIVLYCRSGNRAGQARQFMIDNGYTPERIVNFGGFSTWKVAGLQVTTEAEDACMCSDAVTAARAGSGARTVPPREMPLLPWGRVRLEDLGEDIMTVSLHDLRGRRIRLSETGLPLRGADFAHGFYVLRLVRARGDEQIIRIRLH